MFVAYPGPLGETPNEKAQHKEILHLLGLSKHSSAWLAARLIIFGTPQACQLAAVLVVLGEGAVEAYSVVKMVVEMLAETVVETVVEAFGAGEGTTCPGR